MAFFWYLALWGCLCVARVEFTGFPSNVTTTCFEQFAFDFSPYFPQTCDPTVFCPRVLFALETDLRDFGFRWDSDSTFIGGNSNELAAETSLIYTINTTINAYDDDGATSGLLFINILCPLTTSIVPPQSATSHTPFALNLLPFVVNPLPSVPLTWSIRGLPTGSGYTMFTNGTFGGVGLFPDTRFFDTTKQLPVTVNYYRGPAGNAASLNLPLRVVPIGPQVVSQIPDQLLTENVIYTQNFARYFQDPDGYTLSYTITWPLPILPAVLNFDGTQAVITGTPLAAQVGVYPGVTICATTAQAPGVSACSAFTMTVAARSQSPPICTYPSPLIKRTGDSVSLDFNTYCQSPTGAGPLTFTADNVWHSPSGLILDSTGLLHGVLIANDAAQSQPLRLLVRATDKDGLFAQVGLQLTVTTLNNPPRTTQDANIAQTATERIYWEYSIVPWFMDPDGDNLTYQVTPYFDSRSAIKFNLQTGLFSGAPNSFDVTQRQYVWFVTAADGKGGESNTATMTLTILPGPHGPTTNPIPLVSPPAYLGVPWSFDIKPYFFDADGDVLTFTISNPVAGSGLTISNGVLMANWNARDVLASEMDAARVTITADDGHNGTVNNYLFYSVIVPPTCTVPTIPAAILTGTGSCTTPPYQLDISKFCTSKYPMTYALRVPPASLTLSASGLLQGPIRETDVRAGSIAVSVNVNTTRGGTSVFDFQVPVQQPYTLQQRTCAAQQVQTCYQGYGCTIQIQPCFVDSGLCYEIVGGAQSSLKIGQTSGIVSGSVTDSDIAQSQPITVTIRVRDQRSGTADFRLAVRMLRASQIIFKPIPDLASISCGDPCCPWNPVDFVVNPTGNISYTWEYGLPPQSKIMLDPTTGRFSGLGTLADVQASPMTLSIIVDSGLPTGPARMPPLTLNVIGKSAIQVISTPQPASTTVRVATPMVYDARQLFRNVDSQTTYTLTTPGLRSLSIDSRSGLITGTVSNQEFILNTSANSGIMTVVASITADNSGPCGGGSATSSLLLLIDPQFGAPTAGGYPSDLQFCENVMLSMNFGAFFTDPKQSSLSFTIQGLAPDTSLTWNPVQGILTGVPGPADFVKSPVAVVVCAKNIVSATTCINVQVSFLRGRRPPIVDPPIPSPVTAVVGQSFTGFFSRHFSDATNQPLIFSISGLPTGSGLGIGPITGIFSGSPNEADFRASPLVLTVFATNEQNYAPNNCSGTGGRARADFLMAVTRTYTGPTCDPITNPYDPPSVGQFWLLDVSRSVRDSQDLKHEYALRGLPPGSGLTIDTRYGILSGLITDSDLKAQPLFISIAVTNGYGQCMLQLRLEVRPRPVAPKAADCRSCSLANGGCQHRCVESGRPCMPTCSCNAGFALQSNGQSCSSIGSLGPAAPFVPVPSNPCDYNNGGCNQLCVNNQGVAICSCRGSYALGPDGRSCIYDACSLNNGGCEQICVAATAKCGCRQGTLKADGRTCGTDIILVGTIPPALVIGCQNFLFDFSTAFRYQGSSPGSLVFDITGLSAGTGFKITPGGMMSGTPTSADCGAKQPLVVTVTASDQKGSIARAVMFVSAFCQISACGNQPQLPTSASVAPVVPEVWATVGQRTRFDVSKYFPASNLAYDCLGLPSSSGLWMSQDGILDGIPSRQDCANSLLGLTVVGRDQRAREYKAIVSIKFNSCQSPRDLWPSEFPNQFQRAPSFASSVSQNQPYMVQIPSAIQTQTQVRIQSQFQLLPSAEQTLSQRPQQSFPSFVSPSLTGAANLPPPSSFAAPPASSISSSSLKSYYPAPPASYSPLSLTGLERSFSSPEDASVNIQTFAQCGKPFFYNVKDVFHVSGLSFAVDGLPSNTGLRISDGGVLTGSLSTADKAASPLTAKVTAVDSYGSFKTLLIRITVAGFCVDSAALDTLILPTQYATVAEPFLLDMSRLALSQCPVPIYELAGLSSTSKLKMSLAGILSGTPSKDECKAYALRVMITCDGQQAGGGSFQLIVACTDAGFSAPILNGQLPPATGRLGQFFLYNAAPYLSSPGGPLTFSVSGPTKNLVMARNGALSGYPNEADVGVITIVAVDERGTQIQSDLSFLPIPQANASVLTFFPMKAVQAFQGNSFSLDFSQRFFPRDGRTVYSIEGLRPGSGLSFDEETGMLAGIPNEEDVRQTQPMRLTVVATLGLGQSSRGVVGVTVVPSTPLLAPKGYSSGSHSTTLVSMPIPPQVAGQGEPFLLGVASSFFDQNGAPLTYLLTGLAPGSGLSIDANNGVIAGNPTRADATAMQPLRLIVSVTNSNGEQVSEPLKLTVFQPTQRAPNQAPAADTIPEMDAVVEQDFVALISQYFADPDGDSLNYALSGLPSKSGLKLDPISGTLSGQANAGDAKASPIHLVVRVDDGLGGATQKAFTLNVYQRARGARNNSPISSTMPRLTANVGDPFSFSARDYFSDPDGDKLIYRAFGFPAGTGLVLDPLTGRLSGSPTTADAKVKQPLVVGFEADDGNGGRIGNILYVSIKSAVQYRSFEVIDDVLVNISGTSSSVPIITMQLGVWTLFQTSRFFPFYQSSNKIRYVIAGFPVGQGLSFDESTGVLSGFPTNGAISNVPVTVSAQYYYNSSLVNTIEQPLFLRFLSASEQKRNAAPIAHSIPDRQVNVNDNLLLNVDSSFSDPDGDPLTFSVLGLPTGSGLMMVPSSGMLFGTPSKTDIEASTVLLTVIAEDGHGHKAQESFFLTFVLPGEQHSGKSVKSCEDLKWQLIAPATVCAQSPKFGSKCPPLVNYSHAQALCASIGARLCSSVELSDFRNVTSGTECTSKGSQIDPIWSSSTCAFNGTVIAQTPNAKTCSSVGSGLAKVKCCADTKLERPRLKGIKYISFSKKTCADLSGRGFAVVPFALNTGVCNLAPRKARKCANIANFTEASKVCEDMGARLCTSNEITDGAIANAGCRVKGRVWTGVSCTSPTSEESTYFSQGGMSSSLSSFPPQCSKASTALPFVCCADFAPSTSFALMKINLAARALSVEWEWKAFTKVSLSYQLGGNNRALQWQGAHEVEMLDGRGTYTISKIQAAPQYTLRFTPMIGRKVFSKQSAFVTMNATISLV